MRSIGAQEMAGLCRIVRKLNGIKYFFSDSRIALSRTVYLFSFPFLQLLYKFGKFVKAETNPLKYLALAFLKSNVRTPKTFI